MAEGTVDNIFQPGERGRGQIEEGRRTEGTSNGEDDAYRDGETERKMGCEVGVRSRIVNVGQWETRRAHEISGEGGVVESGVRDGVLASS